jgi:uncharacterized protein (TIGR00299 family) protein
LFVPGGFFVKILFHDFALRDMTVGAPLLQVPSHFSPNGAAPIALPDTAWRKKPSSRHPGGKFSVHVTEDQPHRHYSDIVGLLERSTLAAEVKEQAGQIFLRLAEAEAKVHGVELSRVHFHEVGALDSIVDIVGTALCLQHLGIKELYASALPLGSGYVETAHGRLPVPAPATAELLRGMPVHGELGAGERVTPTGAAILAALCSGFGAPPSFTVSDVGNGAGDRDFPDTPNILRVMLGEKQSSLPTDEIRVLETQSTGIGNSVSWTASWRLPDVAFTPLQ